MFCFCFTQKHLSPGRAPPKKRCQPLAKEASTETPDDNADPGEEPEVPEHEPIVPSAEGNPVPKASTCDVGVQWPDVSDHTYSRTKLTSTATQTDPAPSMSAYDMKAKDSAFFTGLSKDVFWALVHSLLAFLTQPMKFKMAPPDQILLVLMRLRLGLMFTDLGQRFAVSRSTACDIFASWVPVMARYMKLNSILWLPRDTLRRIRPLSFLENYPRATCIIDCTEIFVQRPKNLKKRAQTYSNYKSHNTYKALYCIAPNGFVMFVSKLFGGRASDVFISQTSGFTDHLLPGDEVLADRGFTIDGILPPGVKLSIPAFTKGLKQLPEDDVTDTRRLANVRIHVERAIRRLKCFKLLSNIIPGRVANVDDIVSICAGLCNLQPMLIQEDLSEEDIEEPMEIEDDDTSMEETEDERYMMDFAEDIE